MPKPCTVCGDAEPVHVHDGDKRIEDYFVVGRGETDFGAAKRWKIRALVAEAQLAEMIYDAGVQHEMYGNLDKLADRAEAAESRASSERAGRLKAEAAIAGWAY